MIAIITNGFNALVEFARFMVEVWHDARTMQNEAEDRQRNQDDEKPAQEPRKQGLAGGRCVAAARTAARRLPGRPVLPP